MDNDDSRNIEAVTKQTLDSLVSAGYELNETIIRRVRRLIEYGDVKCEIGKRKAIIAYDTELKGVYSVLTVFRNGNTKLKMCFEDPFKKSFF